MHHAEAESESQRLSPEMYWQGPDEDVWSLSKARLAVLMWHANTNSQSDIYAAESAETMGIF